MTIDINQQGDVCILRVEGRFVTGTNPEYLQKKLEELKRLHQGKVLIDLSRMPHIGSAGIGFLVGIFTSVEASCGRFVMVGLQPRVREVFDSTRLSTIVPLSKDLASGLAALGSEGHAAI